MRENWRAVIGYETTYEISDRGRVRRLRGLVASPRSSSGFRMAPGGIRSRALVKGYWCVTLCQDGKMRMIKVHALVAAAFIGPRPTGYDVNHKDGNKQNNHPSNLEYVTEARNNQHAYEVCGKRERMPRGEQHRFAKLSEADVNRLRSLRAAKIPLRTVAAALGISEGHAYGVARGRTWSHV
jgi:hypothetical protein